jgi:hypothetical protein
MPNKYLNKYSHNHNFLNKINEDYPEDYFDWKVTVQFYTSLHKCYCVLVTNKILIETSHKSNIANLKTIDSDISFNLHKLYNHSRISRYEGFLSEESMLRINKINFDEGKGLMSKIETDILKHFPTPASI